MPRYSNFPTLYNECKQLNISDLKRWKYIKPNHYLSGILTWRRAGNKTGSISILVNTQAEIPYIELNYKYNDKPINYRIQLVSINSNLGKGVIWYFLCPAIKKLCRKLYLVDTYFLHRDAFKGCFYEKQTYSHDTRMQIKYMELLFGADEAYEQIYSKYFKTHYNGKPTRRYKRLLKKANAIM